MIGRQCKGRGRRKRLSASCLLTAAEADSSGTHEFLVDEGDGGEAGLEHSICLIQYFRSIMTKLGYQLLYRR